MTTETSRLTQYVHVPAFLLRDREKEIAELHARIVALEAAVAYWRGQLHQALMSLRFIELAMQSGLYGMTADNLNGDISRAIAATVDAVRKPK